MKMSESDLEKPDDQTVDPSIADDAAAQAEPSELESPDVIDMADSVDLAVELEAANDRLLRSQAELENFRKRTRRELDDQRRFANLPLLGDLLPVLDNLDRAAEQTDSTTGLLAGVKMVSSQMLSILMQHGCRPIEADGVAFDPNLHEAIGKEPSAASAEGIVTRVTRVGYQLHDRVVRPPQVFISSGPPANDSDSTTNVDADGTPTE
jgi:molecular chaperone GrpE